MYPSCPSTDSVLSRRQMNGMEASRPEEALVLQEEPGHTIHMFACPVIKKVKKINIINWYKC